MFKKAIKQEAKLRLAIAGPSGSGKTYTALAIASNLGKKIALVDTEHGSASKYADLFSFDVLEMKPPFAPDRFITSIQEAQAMGYDVIILDSLTHAWQGTGGLLDMVDQIAARSSSKNTFAAWKEGTPIYNRLIDSIIQSEIHIIATMRSKQDYAMSKDDQGKTKVEKLGLAPIQREGFEYEFDVVLNIDIDNTAIVSKTRCPALTGGVYKKPGKEIAEILVNWLTGLPRQDKAEPSITPSPVQPITPPAPAPAPAPTEVPGASHVPGTRPYPPDVFKAKLNEIIDGMPAAYAKAGKPLVLTPPNIGNVLAKIIDAIFNGDKGVSRHIVCAWLIGTGSTKDMSPAQVRAFFKIMDIKYNDQHTPDFLSVPSAVSIDEFRAAYVWAKNELNAQNQEADSIPF